MSGFKLTTDYIPAGDQPQAIEKLLQGLHDQQKHQVLLGITGSGKTFTMANIIQRLQKPALVVAHNKTLAAQLYSEFKSFFPENAVEYFVSYYDYYQPEAYVPSKDLFIEKDSSINDELDRLRLSATRSLLERDDVIIVASVSCIYGLGSPEEYGQMLIYIVVGSQITRKSIIEQLIELQFTRNEFDFKRGTFRVRGDVVEIFPGEADFAIRVEMFGDDVENITKFDPLTGHKLESLTRAVIYPNSHYVTPADRMPESIELIREELTERLKQLKMLDKIVEYHRLKQRTEFDIEMLEETGFCTGIENYSRIFQRRIPGSAPPTLIDYFPKDAVIFIDESHQSIPQIRGMSMGDLSRKTTLVEHGFRLPSAIDNRPLRFEEFEALRQQLIYVSATPADYEIQKSQGQVVEQVIRPTGLLDPVIEVRPVQGQVDDMLHEIRIRVQRKERVLVTTLTKKMAEDLTEYYRDLGVLVRYMHSDIDAIERTQILRDLRKGEFDVLVGINLLREGLDLPEVSLIGIFDADKEGFLRSTRSLIQTIGRAARNVDGTVYMYADRMTNSMKEAITITQERRKKQALYNQANGITPTTIYKKIAAALQLEEQPMEVAEEEALYESPQKLNNKVKKLEKEMLSAAQALEFEKAATLRDEISRLKKNALGLKV